MMARLTATVIVLLSLGCGAPAAGPQVPGVEKVMAHVRGIT
jgi:hypothetical protein